MLTIEYEKDFLKKIKKLKDRSLKTRVKKQVKKIIEDPLVGKPMRYGRKGTRELYVPPFRLAYSFLRKENKIILLDLYHKDEQ